MFNPKIYEKRVKSSPKTFYRDLFNDICKIMNRYDKKSIIKLIEQYFYDEMRIINIEDASKSVDKYFFIPGSFVNIPTIFFCGELSDKKIKRVLTVNLCINVIIK